MCFCIEVPYSTKIDCMVKYNYQDLTHSLIFIMLLVVKMLKFSVFMLQGLMDTIAVYAKGDRGLFMQPFYKSVLI